MSLVDYPLFSWVVVIHSLHVSSFREAHHQEIIFPVQSASGIVCTVFKNFNKQTTTVFYTTTFNHRRYLGFNKSVITL